MSGPRGEYNSTPPIFKDKGEVIPQYDQNGRRLVRPYVPTTVVNGQKTVSSSGTAEALGSSTDVKYVEIKALSGNSNNVYVGDSSVSSSNGYVLASGEKVKIHIDDIANVYLDVDTGGEGVSYIGVK